jgi:hypothetical protein
MRARGRGAEGTGHTSLWSHSSLPPHERVVRSCQSLCSACAGGLHLKLAEGGSRAATLARVGWHDGWLSCARPAVLQKQPVQRLLSPSQHQHTAAAITAAWVSSRDVSYMLRQRAAGASQEHPVHAGSWIESIPTGTAYMCCGTSHVSCGKQTHCVWQSAHRYRLQSVRLAPTHDTRDRRSHHSRGLEAPHPLPPARK